MNKGTASTSLDITTDSHISLCIDHKTGPKQPHQNISHNLMVVFSTYPVLYHLPSRERDAVVLVLLRGAADHSDPPLTPVISLLPAPVGESTTPSFLPEQKSVQPLIVFQMRSLALYLSRIKIKRFYITTEYNSLPCINRSNFIIVSQVHFGQCI